MNESGGFTLTVDNIFATVAGWPLSWYGATYSLGFAGLALWLLAQLLAQRQAAAGRPGRGSPPAASSSSRAGCAS